MTMHEEWTDKLSEYLDGELSAAEAADVEAHLRGCSACAEVLNDLKRVVVKARSLEPRPPRTELWPGIAARTETRAARRVSFTLAQLAAAAVVLMALSGAIVWQVAGRVQRPRPAESQAAVAPAPDASDALERDASAERFVAPVSLADAQYDAAVADLEKALKAGRGRLDKSTVDIVEHNLQMIDQAITQARDALAADPANTYLSSHLVEARRRKMDLLRRAAALAESN